MALPETVQLPIGKQKRIALVAHDNKKSSLIHWVKENRDSLARHCLCGTGTTAQLIAQECDLPVRAYNSGPLGGDQQIGARVVENSIDFMIFFWDPLEAQPHDPDVKALLRIAVLYDIPIAMNRATADFLVRSEYMNEEYQRQIQNYNRTIQQRLQQYSSGE